MFIVTCSHCGAQHQQDEGLVPVSGVVTKCGACGKAMIVMPPKGGDTSGVGKLPSAPPPRATQTQTPPRSTIAPQPRPTQPPPSPAAKKFGPALAAFDAEENDFGGGVDL